MKKLEIFKYFEENEESALLKTIRIPKNLQCLTNKLPQPNYEKKQKSYSDEIKDSLPDIKMSQNIPTKNNEKKFSEKESENKKDTEESKKVYRNSAPTATQYLNTDDNATKKNNDNQNNIQKKKRRFENNDRSLDNLKRNDIYVSSNNSNNIKIVKSENYDKNINNSILMNKSPQKDGTSVKKKREFTMLPNIKNQGNNER